MKRSKANEILERRAETFGKYVHYIDDQGLEPVFTHSGCEICQDGAGDVYECLAYPTLKSAQQENPDNLDICPGCFCAYHTGDNSDLEYSVTDEDCEPA